VSINIAAVAGVADFFRNLFGSVFSRSDPLDRVATYLVREHQRGRPLVEILDDPYVRNRTTPAQLARLLDNPHVVRELGKDVVESARATLR
jgi:hypothetical protein